MLSVGNRNGRKGLGFVGDMEDTELEEGEACSHQDDDPTVDPDIALAYLDEKLHNVLGHFQKDFEGGVSAENLGAKFGGYGSFLPTYQRSPVCSHPRTPKVQNHALRSPSNLQLEGGFHNITTPASVPLPVHCPDVDNSRTLPLMKPSSSHDRAKLDAGMGHGQAENSTLRVETVKKFSLPDQKKLKVRIRVGSDNLSTQTKAELYSGLGLDASPSSSFEDSPESEGWSREPLDAPDESPNSILHIMTSFPLLGNKLLSPLAEDLAYLTGKKKSQRGWRPDSVSESETGKSHSLANGPSSSRKNGKLSLPKNKKSSGINGMSLELSNGCTKDVQDVISKMQKERDNEAAACENLISKALKLLPQSTSDSTASDFTKSNGKVSGVFSGGDKAAMSLELGKVESTDLFVNRDDVWSDEKPTAEVGSAGNLLEDQKEKLVSDTEVEHKRYLIRQGGKNFGSPGTELNPSKVVRTMKQEIIISPTLKTDLKAGFQEPDGRSTFAVKDKSSSKAKCKSNSTPGHNNAAEAANGKARDGSSFPCKLENRVNQASKYEAGNIKMQNDARKSRDTYKDLFGEFDVENEDNVVEPLEYPSRRGPKCSQVTDVAKRSLNRAIKEKASSKKIEKPITSESHSKSGSHAAPPVSGLVQDAPAPPAPVLIEEHWVCCDKCQKWRLLPLGRLPDSLPEKWLCSMLDWLPGMNRCDIEEEETTKALVSFYQASVPESDKNSSGHFGGRTPEALSAGIQHPSFRFNSAGSITKKKTGMPDMTMAVRSQGPGDVGDRTKSLQPAVKSRSLNDVNQSPSVTDLDITHPKMSSDLFAEKNEKLSNDKQKLHDHFSDGGDMRNVKTHKKRGAGHDSPRAFKKHKNVDPTDDGWLSETDHHVPSRNGGPNSSSILKSAAAGQDRVKSTEAMSYNNHIVEEMDNSQTSYKKSKNRVHHSVDVSVEKMRGEAKDSSAKKRKTKGSQESRHSESIPTAGLKAEEIKGSLKDESSQRHRSKEKKARLTNKEMRLSDSKRESNAERGNLAVPKDLKPAQDPDNISFKRSMEGRDPSRRDLASTHPFTEATSSSSKISSSRKSKANLQDAKGSPVESVSSSPLRSRSKDRPTSNGRNVFDKECPSDGFGLSGSPKRYSDNEIDGRSGAMGHVKQDNGRMDKAYIDAHKGTKVSSVLDFRDSVSGGKSNGKLTDCEEPPFVHSVSEVANTSDQHQHKLQASDCGPHEEACNTSHNLLNRSLPVKKGYSVRSKDRMRKPKSSSDKTNASNLFDNFQDRHANGDKLLDEKLVERTSAKSHKLEQKNDMNVFSKNGKNGGNKKPGSDDGEEAKPDIFPTLSYHKQSLVQEYGGTSNTLPPEKMDLLQTSQLRGKSVVRSPFIGGSSKDNCHNRHSSGSDGGNEIDNLNIDAFKRDDSLKGPKPFRKADNQNVAQPTTSRHPTPTGHKAKDLNAPSPARRDSSSQSASNAIKEAKSLKHMADRVKSSGSNAESIGLYFQAALKFLLGASLLESSTSETRHGDMIQSTQMYSSTAKLCEFCAYEYEKAKDMAFAALAYKCTEVAYMRVIYSSHCNANRDRHELQTALQMAPPGESPSSSASDVDNLNNAATGDKVLVAKGVSSPQVVGSHVISARNRPGFARLLSFAQDVNFAMEASRKSQVALAAANVHLEQVHNEDGISSIKRALDYNFQDVEGLLRLVRLGMEAISR
uniref:CW-type domain-containing protein n=1 Tax=Kalanchoe fedtschenkoi TaxID=63787 RepID=A0A7N0T7C1_KALFE